MGWAQVCCIVNDIGHTHTRDEFIIILTFIWDIFPNSLKFSWIVFLFQNYLNSSKTLLRKLKSMDESMICLLCWRDHYNSSYGSSILPPRSSDLSPLPDCSSGSSGSYLSACSSGERRLLKNESFLVQLLNGSRYCKIRLKLFLYLK